MAWTTPKTWADGNVLTADELNEQVRDNLDYLYDKPSSVYTADEAALYSTTSTTFVDVDSTNLTHTINISGTKVLIWFYGNVTISGPNRVATYFDIELNETSRLGNDDGLIMCIPASISTVSGYTGAVGGSSYFGTVTLVYLATGLTPGDNTFTLQWKGAGAVTSYLLSGAGTTDNDVHPQFGVMEV